MARLSFLAFLPAALAVGCSSASNDSDDAGAASQCVSAPSCPDADVPSYSMTIAPILQRTCILSCHSPDGSAGFAENTYSAVSSQAGDMLSQVAQCFMPPSGGPVMSDAERIALTGWLECGAPDN
jgi:hypothetical protein